MYFPLIQKYIEMYCERQLSVIISHSVRRFKYRFVRSSGIVADAGFCCINFLFGSAWLITNPTNLQDDLYLKNFC